MTTWKFEKQFVNKLSLLRIILQRKRKTVSCVYYHHQVCQKVQITRTQLKIMMNFITVKCKKSQFYEENL